MIGRLAVVLASVMLAGPALAASQQGLFSLCKFSLTLPSMY
jgi:hypothetical protein